MPFYTQGKILTLIVLLWLAMVGPVQADKQLAVNKVHGKLSVMVLGSGGPVATPAGRASAGYLIFVDGEPRILMDAGGGTYQRLAASGTNIKDLDIVLLSHLHIDHTGDLSSIIKTVYFHNRAFNLANDTFPPGRTKAFQIFGPNQNGIRFSKMLKADADTTQYPATTDYIDKHYDLNDGVERYLNLFGVAISGGAFDYEAQDVNPDWQNYSPTQLFNQDGLKIIAVGVKHGPAPALAFRIDYKDHSIVFTGDTNTEGHNLTRLAQNADMLIYDTAIMDNLPDGPNDAAFFELHTTPSRIGQVATEADVEQLVLSHITPVTGPRLAAVKRLIRTQGYEGKISEAKDLKVYNLGRSHGAHDWNRHDKHKKGRHEDD